MGSPLQITHLDMHSTFPLSLTPFLPPSLTLTSSTSFAACSSVHLSGCPGYYYKDGEQVVFSWDDKNVRRIFIRKVKHLRLVHITLGNSPPQTGRPGHVKDHTVASLIWICLRLQVYAILMFQLFATVGIVALFTFW